MCCSGGSVTLRLSVLRLCVLRLVTLITFLGGSGLLPSILGADWEATSPLGTSAMACW